MIRAAGGAIVILAGVLLGFASARDLEKEYLQMRELQRILYMIHGEIRYARSFLSETFRLVAETAEEPYRSWMKNLYRKMEEPEDECFSAMWRASVEEDLKGLAVRKEEKRLLAELGKYFGGADIKTQLRHLEFYGEHLEEEMKRRKESLGARQRLCKVLGTSGGVFLAILLM